MLKRWFPFPLLSVVLLAVWLVLNRSIAPGHILLGAVIASVAARTLAQLQVPERIPLRLVPIVVLLTHVLVDIVRSNGAVAGIVLRPRHRAAVTSGFVTFELQLRHPAALAALACIITATPGTSWAGYDADRGELTLHLLDNVDEASWVALVRTRYEARLLEIFA